MNGSTDLGLDQDRNNRCDLQELTCPTCLHVDHAVGVAGGDKAVLQHQALAVVGTVVDEGLPVARRPADAPDLVAPGHVVEARFHLQENDEIGGK